MKAFGLDRQAKHLQCSQSCLRSSKIIPVDYGAACLREGLSASELARGLYLIVQGIGNSMRNRANTTQMDFEVGRLVFGLGTASFTFARHHPKQVLCKPARSGGEEKSVVSRVHSLLPADSPPVSADSRRSHTTTPSSRAEIVYGQALERHLAQMELRAAEAAKARELTEGQIHSQRCDFERETEEKRKRQLANLKYVEQQMRLDSERRLVQKREWMENSCFQDFPRFSQQPAKFVEELAKSRSEGLLLDLGLQVRGARAAKSVAKLKEVALVRALNEENATAMARAREAEILKKNSARHALVQSWEQEMRLRNFSKLIENFDMLPPDRVGEVARRPFSASVRPKSVK